MKTSFTFKKLLFKSLFLAFIFVFASCEKESISESVLAVDASAKASEKANPSPAAQQGDQTIAEIVLSYSEADEPQFTLLLAALEYTGLTGVFTGGDNYTVFAPTDAAFLEFLGGDANNLYDLPVEAVTEVLLYHVTDGRRFSNSVLGKNNWKEIEMLNGGIIHVSANGEIDTDGDMEEDSSILVEAGLFDLPATNGVIHVISDVLNPAE